MTTTFDFKNGNGPVPAHRHSNGGGWIADTATVADTAYVGPDAQVYDNAWVYGKARVYDDTCNRLSDRAEKSDTNENIFIEMNDKRYKLVEVEKS